MIDRLPRRWQVALLVAPILASLVVAAVVVRAARGTEGDFCNQATVLVAEGAQQVDDGDGLDVAIDRLRGIDLETVLAGFPEELAEAEDVIRREGPELIERIDDLPPGTSVLEVTSPELLAALAEVVEVYEQRC